MGDLDLDLLLLLPGGAYTRTIIIIFVDLEGVNRAVINQTNRAAPSQRFMKAVLSNRK